MTMRSIYIILILTGLFFSCTKEVKLDLADQEGSNLVIEALITDKPGKQWVKLSLTNSYYSEGPSPAVSGAIVEIQGNNTTYSFTESSHPDSAGFYYNDQIAQELTETVYNLTVVVNGQTYTGVSTYKTAPVLDSIAFLESPFNELANSGLQPGEDSVYVFDIYTYFNNPAGNLYYLFDRYLNHELKTNTPSSKILLQGEDLIQGNISFAVSTNTTDSHSEGDTVTIELQTISKELFDFYVVYFNQTDLSGNPFAGAPPANIPTNLSEGAVGFFQVSSVSSATRFFFP